MIELSVNPESQNRENPPENELSTASLENLYTRLKSSEAGLDSQEAAARLKIYGPNEPAPQKDTTILLQILRLFNNPLVIILLFASLVSAIVGEVINSSIIIVMVLLSVMLNFIQNYRSQKAAARLKAVVAPMATVKRDGKWLELPRREIVPGDVVELAAGDLVPADARLIDSQDLHVQQSALTGESLPVEKEAYQFSISTPANTIPGKEKSSSELSSSFEAPNLIFLGTSVVSGTATALVLVTGPHTAFGDIAARLAKRPPETEFERGNRKFGYLIMWTIFCLVLFIFFVSAAFHRDPLESFLFAIALAVGLTPEFLPMITTVTLSQGASKMAKQKVIVKNLAALQNFGSIDILCSDKTGTLTSGQMVLAKKLDPTGQPSEQVYLLAYLNSYHETGIKSPLDAEILRGTKPAIENYKKLDEMPFDFERRRLSVVVEDLRSGERTLITKGAPEGILSICNRYDSGGKISDFDQASRNRCEAIFEELSAQGYRVLAVGYRKVETKEAYRIIDEKELVLAGFLAFFDPPLENVTEVINALRQDGIEIKILTGDNEQVAQHVCQQVGLDSAKLLLGSQIEHMTDTALGHAAEQTTIFARVSPAQKNRIILALKSRTHVVGFMGDGINDAPSLHAADVGISVSSGVDVAKDAAEIILLEPGLKVLHQGIIEGRKAFGNVMKYLLMGTSSNFGNMFSMAGAFLFLNFLPMLPTQILLNNFLYDLAQITIPTDNVDSSFIRKPHRWDIGLIRNFMLWIGPISSIYDFLTFFTLLWVFNADASLFQSGWFVESLATQTLVVFVIRTAGNPLRSRPSLALTLTVIGVVTVGILLPYTPLAGLMGFVALPASYYLFMAGFTLTYLLLVEVVKRRLLGQSFER
ncbi:MAG TPA: magnesium-translocating P-type ATPase [Chloroflexia bacterium]|nr:magnesium-translocating P-type ATPase [Chloroflexia bacterium]